MMKNNLEQSYTFARELTTLAILLIIFECIYIDRFVFDLLLAKNADPLNDDESPFKYHNRYEIYINRAAEFMNSYL